MLVKLAITANIIVNGTIHLSRFVLDFVVAKIEFGIVMASVQVLL